MCEIREKAENLAALLSGYAVGTLYWETYNKPDSKVGYLKNSRGAIIVWTRFDKKDSSPNTWVMYETTGNVKYTDMELAVKYAIRFGQFL